MTGFVVTNFVMLGKKMNVFSEKMLARPVL